MASSHREARSSLSALLAIAATIAFSAPLAGQSIVQGEIQGTVREIGQTSLEGSAITITGVRGGVPVLSQSGTAGFFKVSNLPPGEYEVLVEELGFVPQLVSDVVIRPGQVVRLDIALRAAPPPVNVVDSVSATASAQPRFDGLGSRWISFSELQAFESPRADLATLAALGPSMDTGLGSEGLPGTTTSVMLDGLPYTPAQHPLQAGWGGTPIVPSIAVASVDIHNRPDVEWWGGSGGTVAIVTRSADADRHAEIAVAGATDALWQSDTFSDLSKPGATSFWGRGAAHLPVASGRGSIFVGAEVLRSETPRPSPVSADVASRLASASPSLSAEDAELMAEPWLSSFQGAAALARLDWQSEGSAQVSVRGGFSSTTQEGSEFFGSSLAYGNPAPFEGTDLYLSGAVSSELSPTTALEIRGGFERSSRTWEGTSGPGSSSRIFSTSLVEEGIHLGPSFGLPGEITRSAFVGNAAVHFRWPNSSLKLGISGSLPLHDFAYVPGSRGLYLYSDAESILQGDGRFMRYEGSAADASFTVPEAGGFAQYLWEPEPGLRLTAGVRVDYEFLPIADVPLNTAWRVRTGLVNNVVLPERLPKPAPRIGLTWDLSGNGNTVLEASLGARYDPLDPAAIAEVFSLSGQIGDEVQLGGLTGWPTAPTGSGSASDTGTALTLFGPDLKAPRTARASGGIAQRVGSNATFSVSATFRRTEFLLRRDDINLVSTPSGSLSDGRPIHGTLTKTGSIISAEPGTEHRFTEFGSVWALNADGWSEYIGLTAGLEVRPTPTLSLFASYTASSTEDNLTGARTGLPGADLPPYLGAVATSDWTSGTSDFDIPHRLTAGFEADLALLEGVTLSGVYRLQSGWAYTAGYRTGVDVNADGYGANDPAFVPDDVSALSVDSSCLNGDLGRIATRNACRGGSLGTIDLHVRIGLFRLGSSVAALSVDAFNLTDTDTGLPDSALLLVESGQSLGTGSGGTVIPTRLNPAFGETTTSARAGRLIRVGLQLGLP